MPADHGSPVIGYTIFMFPGSIFLRYVRPNLQIGGAAIAFGTFLCGMSVAKTYATVVVMRVFIGAAQAFVQNSGVYNSLWYLRREVAFRGGEYPVFPSLGGSQRDSSCSQLSSSPPPPSQARSAG